MLFAPIKACAGSKLPVTGLVIPVPDQVPPGVTELSVVTGSVEQNGPAGLMVVFGAAFTVT